MNGAFADSGAVGGDFFFPGLRGHGLRPEWPGSALGGTPFIDGTFFFPQERTGAGVPDSLQVKVIIGLRAELARESASIHFQVPGQTLAIFQGEINITVLVSGNAAPARALALKSDTFLPPVT